PVAGELVDRASKLLHDDRRAANQVSHDLAQTLRTDSRRDIHRMHYIGKQNRDLLVLRALGGRCDFGTAGVTEPRPCPRLGATRTARRYGRHPTLHGPAPETLQGPPRIGGETRYQREFPTSQQTPAPT